jgi:hypothetical protein
MLIILLSIAGAFLVTYLLSLLFGKTGATQAVVESENPVPDVDCCGAHEVCDKDTLLSTSDEIVYYNDEELDEYKNVPVGEYTTSQIEMFREVLYTMRDDEVAGWLRSLQLRNIQLPHIVREEALMVVSDLRDIIRKVR